MSSINETVDNAIGTVPAEARQYKDRAVEALVERERGITDGLITLVVTRGIASKEQAVQIAQQFGLEVRPEPEPVVAEPVNEQSAVDESLSTNALLQSISDGLDSLKAFARQHGYRG